MLRLLVLYEELAPYIVNCINTLAKQEACNILLIHKQVNETAPFESMYFHSSINKIQRESSTNAKLMSAIEKFGPNALFIAGWSNPFYLKVLKKINIKNTFIGFDNHYHGTIRQLLGILYFKLFVRPYIQAAFVPGKRQAFFAKKLGFTIDRIYEGAYCCDYDMYRAYFKQTYPVKQKLFPRRFIYMGRYASEKAVSSLWRAFIELQSENPNDWELWCIGKGDIQPVMHPKIKHIGFVQPFKMKTIIEQTGVFVLPSIYEPWGVVVHEFATCGFPLLCSDKVGSADTFVRNGENGYVFEAGNIQALKEKLKIMMQLPEEKLILMGEKSAELAQQITPAKWADTIMKICSYE